MNVLRLVLFGALVGGMAVGAQAQWGSPEPIPLPQVQAAPMPGSSSMVMPAAYYGQAVQPGPQIAPLPPVPNGRPAPQPAASNSAVVSQMLNEPSPLATNVPAGQGDCSVMAPGGCMQNAGCPGAGCYSDACCQPWYFSARALYMTRNQPNKVYTSAQAAAQVNQGYYNDFDWSWGGEATLGYRFGCGCQWALEGTYWGISASTTSGDPGITGPYVTPMIFGLTDMLNTGLNGNPNQTANLWFDNSPDHRITRTWEVENVEANIVRTDLLGCSPCDRFGIDFLMGFRWMHFRDTLLFSAQRQADGSPYAGDYISLNDKVTNDLLGFQVGFNANYRFAECWKLFLTPKVGIYNNHIQLDDNVYATSQATGTQYQASSQTYANPNYPVHAATDTFAFLTQVDLGVDWQITRHLSAQAGYRVVAATGIGLSDNQIPFYGNDTPAIADIDCNGSLILHGAFAGLTFTW